MIHWQRPCWLWISSVFLAMSLTKRRKHQPGAQHLQGRRNETGERLLQLSHTLDTLQGKFKQNGDHGPSLHPFSRGDTGILYPRSSPADPAVSLSRPRSTSSRDFCDRNKMPPPQAACREHPQFALKPCPCQPAFLKHPCRSRSHQWLNPTAAAVFALSKQNATVSCPTRPLPRTAAPALLSCHRHRVTVSPSPSCGLGPPSCSHSRE